MDPLIENLKSTTFLGKRFTRKQLADIQITVGRFPKLSRAELGRTICEHLRWRTPGGRDRLKSALGLLEELERLGILSLPPKRHRGRGRQKPVELTSRTAPRSLIDGPLAGLAPLQLEPVTKPEAVAEWNEWVQRYHPLGYRQPLGTHLRYFLLDGEKRQLGCLLFDFAARNVRCRDKWIGWPVGRHHRHLNLVVRNARFVLFPWVQVKCLASQALGLALRQLPQDWQRRHGCRPVLAETYVDPRQHQGTCYRAANWQCVGQTQARGAMGGVPAKTPKDVYVYPLHADWRRILQQGPPKAAKPRRSPPRAGPRFVQLWQELIGTLVRVAGAHDREWIKRRRTLNTLLVMLFVFRLVFAPDRRGYATVLAELWDHCRQLEVALPQPQPVSAAAICQARAKVDEEVFRSAHRAVLERLPGDGPGALWHGHRAFAVDGSKLNLPRPLVRAGYRTPGDKAHYPQGLLSCLYQLRARLPVDFDLHAHGDERRGRPGPPSPPSPPAMSSSTTARLLLLPAAARPLRASPARGLPPAAQRQRPLPRVHARRPQRRARDGPAQRPGAAAVPAGRAAALPRAPRQVRHRRPQLHAGHHAAGPQALPRAGAHRPVPRPLEHRGAVQDLEARCSRWSTSMAVASAWSSRNCTRISP